MGQAKQPQRQGGGPQPGPHRLRGTHRQEGKEARITGPSNPGNHKATTRTVNDWQIPANRPGTAEAKVPGLLVTRTPERKREILTISPVTSYEQFCTDGYKLPAPDGYAGHKTAQHLQRRTGNRRIQRAGYQEPGPRFSKWRNLRPGNGVFCER